MTPTSFKETNQLLGAGNNPGTGDLPIARSLMPIGDQEVPCIVSCWKLSPEELERVKETGQIWLSIMGTSMPPVMPMAFHPFDHVGIKAIKL